MGTDHSLLTTLRKSLQTLIPNAFAEGPHVQQSHAVIARFNGGLDDFTSFLAPRDMNMRFMGPKMLLMHGYPDETELIEALKTWVGMDKAAVQEIYVDYGNSCASVWEKPRLKAKEGRLEGMQEAGDKELQLIFENLNQSLGVVVQVQRFQKANGE